MIAMDRPTSFLFMPRIAVIKVILDWLEQPRRLLPVVIGEDLRSVPAPIAAKDCRI